MPGLMRRDARRRAATVLLMLAPVLAAEMAAADADRDLGCAPMPAVVLAQLNALRAAGADCGTIGRFGPAGPLRWSDRLAAAADTHAAHLSGLGRLEHRDADGRDGGQRIRALGYAYSQWAENLAAGPEALDLALQDWLASPGHCANLLHPGLQEAGLACRGAPGHRRTWVLALARPAGR